MKRFKSPTSWALQ